MTPPQFNSRLGFIHPGFILPICNTKSKGGSTGDRHHWPSLLYRPFGAPQTPRSGETHPPVAGHNVRCWWRTSLSFGLCKNEGNPIKMVGYMGYMGCIWWVFSWYVVGFKWDLASGKHTKSYGTSPFCMGKSTIPMTIFNSYVGPGWVCVSEIGGPRVIIETLGCYRSFNRVPIGLE